MLGEVVEGFGPFHEVDGWVSSFFIRHVISGVGADFGHCVYVLESFCASEKCTCPHEVLAVWFGLIFLGRGEPNQAETD